MWQGGYLKKINDILDINDLYFSSSLAYSNIMAEWLSAAKHNRVYLPEVS